MDFINKRPMMVLNRSADVLVAILLLSGTRVFPANPGIQINFYRYSFTVHYRSQYNDPITERFLIVFLYKLM